MFCISKCLSQRKTFYIMMVLTTSMFLVEIIVGYLTESMALVADSFHMLSDLISLFVGYISMKISKKKKDEDCENTFGWVRAEVLGALINGIFLIALCFSIIVQALKRLVEPEKLHRPLLILAVGAVGLLVNIVGMCLFHGHTGYGEASHSHSHNHGKVNKDNHLTKRKIISDNKNINSKKQEFNGSEDCKTIINDDETNLEFESNKCNEIFDSSILSITTTESSSNIVNGNEQQVLQSGGTLNMKGVYLHLISDMLGSIVVIAAALTIHFFDGKQWTLYIDPIMSILMVCFILQTLAPLVKESSMILLQNVPSHILVNTIQEKLLLKFPEIQSVHEFHVWQLTNSKIVASIHMKLQSYNDYEKIALMVKEFFHDEGLHSTTIQPECIEKVLCKPAQCLFGCGQLCQDKLCCVITPSESSVVLSVKP